MSDTTQEAPPAAGPPPEAPRSIEKLAAALAKAQGAFTTIAKTRTVKVRTKNRATGEFSGEYEYSYAELDAVIAATRPALSANGLAAVQSVKSDGKKVRIVTELLHESGQRLILGVLDLDGDGTPQGMGSVITYGRRYSLAAALCVAAESDDDGQGAQADHDARQRPARDDRRQRRDDRQPRRDDRGGPRDDRQQRRDEPRPPRDAAPPPPEERPAAPQQSAPAAAGPVITEPQVARLWTLAKQNEWSKDQLRQLLGHYGWESTKQVTPDKYEEVIRFVEEGRLPGEPVAEREPGEDG